MELEFEIVSYHRLSPEQVSKKRVREGMTFGRSEKNDWHLPDPEKVVSGTHARIERLGQGFVIYDLSTNGLYINRSVEALGKDKPHRLCEGDLLAFGDYEISVSPLEQSLGQEKPSQAVPGPSEIKTAAPRGSGIAVDSVLAAGPDILGPQALQSQASLPEVGNDLNDHFSLPQTAIPKEWELELLGKTAPVPADDSRDVLAQDHSEQAVKAVPQAGEENNRHIFGQGQMPRVKKKNKSSNVGSNPGGELQAFIKGLGISPEVLPEEFSDELLYRMGQGMGFLLTGLMDSLRSRASLKHEFRVNQTTFQQQENNPLKFSASLDDVFENLFLRSSKSFLSSKRAITEAFDDIRKHDIALTAGTLGAVAGVLNQLAPELIASRDFKASPLDKLLPGQKQLRYWKIYQRLHQDLVQEQDGQGGALSDDFIRAYDEKIKSL